MTDIMAALGLVQLERYKSCCRDVEIVELYDSLLHPWG